MLTGKTLMKCSGLFPAIRALVCVALFWGAVPAVWAQSNPTITSLNMSPGTSVSAGTILTFTATVTSSGSPVSSGLVKFCDMETATYCEDSAVLGSIGVTTSGTATLRMPLAYGTHNVQAEFQGTKLYAGSSSAPQVVGVLTGALPSTTSVVFSAYLGNGGLNEAQATVSGAPIPALSGTLSYLDLSNSGYLLTSAPLTTPTNGFSALASVGGTPIPEPFYTVVGDFNGDGKLDFAVASDYVNTAQVFLGNGDGTFTLKSTISTPYPAGLIVGDFNGDGNLDLAVLNYSTISIYLGNGDGTFSLKSTPPAGDSPYSIAAADFNGDGILDFAVTNNYSNTVQILLGNGDGTFTTGALYPTGNDPEDIVVADFNRDGKTDLAIVNEMDSSVTVLLGNGNGTFTAGPSIHLPANPYTLVVGDFNGDGIPDLAVSAVIQGAEIYLGNGDGTFNLKSTVVTGSSGRGYGMATADFNHDGKTDLVVGGALFAGDGTGNFTLMSHVSGNGSPVSVGDFNGDGSPDLITPVYSNSYPFNGTVNISLEQSAVTMVTNPIEVLGSGSHNVVASYSGDGVHAASQSSSVAMTGAPIATTLSLGVTPGTSVSLGTAVQITAAISPNLVGGYSPTGTMTFNDGSTVLGTGIVSLGQAVFSTSALSVGTHTITASYGGDTNFVALSSAPTVITVASIAKTPVITWANPAAISYGTPLSGTQLNASSGGVAGSFVYTPAAGTMLGVGVQTLSVTFTPTDTTNYTTATQTASLTVNKATPTITWATPAAISYGTALSATQLNASSTVAGTYVYTPALGTALTAGTQILSVTLSPTDTTDYNTATQTVSLTVNKATASVTPMAATKVYGTIDPILTGSLSGWPGGRQCHRQLQPHGG
jgi:hypothetical protein